jgi:phage-related protein
LIEYVRSDILRIEAGFLLRRLQRGESLGLPHSRPFPTIGARCHELRIVDRESTWRIVYRIDGGAIVILEVFSKKTQLCRMRSRTHAGDD